jgi:hypothetical protein
VQAMAAVSVPSTRSASVPFAVPAVPAVLLPPSPALALALVVRVPTGGCIRTPAVGLESLSIVYPASGTAVRTPERRSIAAMMNVPPAILVATVVVPLTVFVARNAVAYRCALVGVAADASATVRRLGGTHTAVRSYTLPPFLLLILVALVIPRVTSLDAGL